LAKARVLACAVALAWAALPAGPASAAQFEVSAQDNVYSPSARTVDSGDSVRWTNNGFAVHTVRAEDNSFNSGDLTNGQTFSVTFTGPSRTVRYYCIYHGAPGGVGMSGTITVEGTSTAQKPPADFNGDGATDVSVWRPSTGQWFVRNQATVSHGLNGDVPVPADYDGNGSTDVAVFRPSVGGWYVKDQAPVFFGLSGDIPVPADYDGNGTADIAVFRPSVGGWYIRNQPTVFLGRTGDIPVAADYDGNNTADVTVFRPSVGGWYRSGAATVFLGLSGDVPVPGDYNGDKTTDVGVFRRSTGQWFTQVQATVSHGLSSDIALPLPAAIRMAAFP
jgi:plastocyanin